MSKMKSGAILQYVSNNTAKRVGKANVRRDKLLKKIDTESKFLQDGVASRDLKEDYSNRNFLDEAKERMIHRGKMAKLEVLLLNYLFFENDGKISFSEKRAIRKHFSSYKNKITDEDMNELSTLECDSLSQARAFIHQQNIEIVDLHKAISTLNKISRNSKEYSQIIEDIERQIINNDNDDFY